MGPLCVFNYNIVIELWVMEIENSQKLFSVFITHNSKIRELSDGNRVIVCQTNFLLWVPPFLSYELWKQRIELSKNPIQTGSKLPSFQWAIQIGVMEEEGWWFLGRGGRRKDKLIGLVIHMTSCVCFAWAVGLGLET